MSIALDPSTNAGVPSTPVSASASSKETLTYERLLPRFTKAKFTIEKDYFSAPQYAARVKEIHAVLDGGIASCNNAISGTLTELSPASLKRNIMERVKSVNEEHDAREEDSSEDEEEVDSDEAPLPSIQATQTNNSGAIVAASEPSSPEEALAHLVARKAAFTLSVDKHSKFFAAAVTTFDEGIGKIQAATAAASSDEGMQRARFEENISIVRTAIHEVNAKIKALEKKDKQSVMAELSANANRKSTVNLKALKADSKGHGRYVKVRPLLPAYITGINVYRTHLCLVVAKARASLPK